MKVRKLFPYLRKIENGLGVLLQFEVSREADVQVGGHDGARGVLMT